jgi:hypothetical protein
LERFLGNFRIGENRGSWEWRAVAQLLSWWSLLQQLLSSAPFKVHTEIISSMSGSLDQDFRIFRAGKGCVFFVLSVG